MRMQEKDRRRKTESEDEGLTKSGVYEKEKRRKREII